MKILSPSDLGFVRRAVGPSARSISVSRVQSHRQGVLIDARPYLVLAKLIMRKRDDAPLHNSKILNRKIGQRLENELVT
jgi:sensor domain CHASE-containing protein